MAKTKTGGTTRKKSPPKTRPMQSLFVSSQSSGVSVNEITALTSAGVWACVKVIASAIASLDKHIYYYDSQGKHFHAVNHPAEKILNNPNPEMTSYVFWETYINNLLLWGNAYAEIIRVLQGKPQEIWHIPSNRAFPDRNEFGDLVYRVWWDVPTMGSGTYDVIDKESILFAPGLSYNGLFGYSTVMQAAESIGTSIAIDQYAASFFGNAITPSGILSVPGVLNDKQRLQYKETLEKSHRGARNANGWLVLDNGAAFQPTSRNPEDSQLVQAKRAVLEHICRFFSVPPSKIYVMERATHTNIEAEAISFVQEALLSTISKIESEINRKLLMPSEQGKYFCRFNLDTLLRGDRKSRYESYAIGRQWGFETTNTILVAEGKNPIGPEGDIYLVPANMVSAERLLDPTYNGGNQVTTNPKQKVEPTEQPTEDNISSSDNIEKSFKSIFEDATSRIHRKENNAIKRMWDKKKSIEDYQNSVNSFFDKDHHVFVQEILSTPVISFFCAIGITSNVYNLAAKSFISETIIQHIENATTYFKQVNNESSFADWELQSKLWADNICKQLIQIVKD